jgi:hypothetical protein
MKLEIRFQVAVRFRLLFHMDKKTDNLRITISGARFFSWGWLKKSIVAFCLYTDICEVFCFSYWWRISKVHRQKLNWEFRGKKILGPHSTNINIRVTFRRVDLCHLFRMWCFAPPSLSLSRRRKGGKEVDSYSHPSPRTQWYKASHPLFQGVHDK